MYGQCLLFGLDELFIMYFSFFPERNISTRRYRSSPITQTQEMQWTRCMPLPTFPRAPLPRCITRPSILKTAQTKLVLRYCSPNPAPLPVNIRLWKTAKVKPPLLSTSHLQRILSTQQSTSHGSNEERSVWGFTVEDVHVLDKWEKFWSNSICVYTA